MCTENLCFIVVKFKGVDPSTDSLTKIGSDVLDVAISLPDILGPSSDLPIFYSANNSNGVKVLYAIKTTRSPMKLTFDSAGEVNGDPLDNSDIVGLHLFGPVPRPKPPING